MIIYKNGDLLNDNAEAIVNTVNCVGIMGRGIALQFKKSFPDNFNFYKAACKNKEVELGKMLTYPTGSLLNPKYIINFPTKCHWRNASRIEDIKDGLIDLVNVIRARKIKSIALPPLGCGLGGLSWSEVKPCMEAALSRLPEVNIMVYEPAGTPAAEKMTHDHAVPKMTPGRAALVLLTRRYLEGLLDPFIDSTAKTHVF
jgi:O-acetyl-ADP-ribose deacetylase (regulator of RNase III)